MKACYGLSGFFPNSYVETHSLCYGLGGLVLGRLMTSGGLWPDLISVLQRGQRTNWVDPLWRHKKLAVWNPEGIQALVNITDRGLFVLCTVGHRPDGSIGWWYCWQYPMQHRAPDKECACFCACLPSTLPSSYEVISINPNHTKDLNPNDLLMIHL